MRASFLRPLLAAVLLGCCAGCLPNATWLPDSSGFAYTGGKNKDTLYLYDLAKKASHVLVEKGAGPAWPAVSPDGKRVAVALRGKEGQTITLEVIVFDRDGKELQRTKLDWTTSADETIEVSAQAFWVPGQDKLLLYSDGVTGFFDLKDKTALKMTDTIPATYRNTPILPDGKGFLAQKSDLPVLIDWDGKETSIDLTNKDLFEQKKDDPEYPLSSMLAFPMMHSSRWDGSNAVVRWGEAQIKIDANKHTAALESIKPATTEDGKIIQDQVKLAGGAVVRAVELTKRYKKEANINSNEPFFGSYRLEVLKPGAKEPTTLMDEAGFFLINPSPDGKTATAKCSKSLDAVFKPSGQGEDMLYVIDGAGAVMDKIDLGK
jgi:hypothetical protein